MDKKTAFRILGISASASLDQAKKAYHKLAKQYHPDIVKNHTDNAFFFESKMKEINLAFRFLMPYLKAQPMDGNKDNKTCLKRKSCKSRQTEKSMQVNIFSIFKKMIANALSSFMAELKAWKADGSSPKTRQSYADTNKTGQAETGKIKSAKVNFSEVLNAVSPAAGRKNNRSKAGLKQEMRSQTHSPYRRYQHFIRLKTGYGSMPAKRSPGARIEEISKIEPVSPVDSIGKN